MTSPFATRPYVICEIGSNFHGLDQALESIRVAAECGADAAKFQLFNPSAMFGFCDGADAYSLPLDWLPRLKEECDAVGIDFGCTAFSPELVAAVDPYVKWHKVASSDAAWPQLLEAVAKTGKPVLISYNESTSDPDTIRSISDAFYGWGSETKINLKCVAAYPADFCDLEEIGEFYQGLSDHTLGYTATVEASRRGAVVIEKHFTAFPELDTPDRPHSLTPAQFTRMMKLIRGGPVESEETAMFLRHNRRLIATRDVAPGEALKYGENFGAYRSLVDDTRGASPFDWDKVEGKAARQEIKRGSAIALEDVG